MNQREEFQQRIALLKYASRRTHSEYLKRDYAKAIKRMKKELALYDILKKKTNDIRWREEHA